MDKAVEWVSSWNCQHFKHYTMPIFFLCVLMNVDYVVVATFVTQYEDSASIAEALHIVRQWNADCSPQTFMVVFCEPDVATRDQRSESDHLPGCRSHCVNSCERSEQ